MSFCPACRLTHSNVQKDPSAGVVTNFSSCFNAWISTENRLSSAMFRNRIKMHREAVEKQLMENKKKFLGDNFTEEDAKPAKPYSIMIKSDNPGVVSPIIKKPYVVYNSAYDSDHWRNVD